MNFAVGVDLGGTRIKAGLVDAQFVVREHRIIPTRAERGPDAILSDIATLIDQLRTLAPEGVRGIGFGSPGVVDHAAGIVRKPPNLPGWDEVAVAAFLSKSTSLPVQVENDANVAALSEHAAGAGRGVADMVMLTLGTGVGGGIIIDNVLHHGAFGSAGELGHTIVVPGGRLCTCGQHGCLEAYASAGNIARIVAERIQADEVSTCAALVKNGRAFDAADVAAAAAAGDALAAEVWDTACRLLGVACVNIQHTLNPRRIVFAGGLTAAGAQLLDPIQRHFDKLTWKSVRDQPELRLAELGDDAGVVGAASLVFRKPTADR